MKNVIVIVRILVAMKTIIQNLRYYATCQKTQNMFESY